MKEKTWNFIEKSVKNVNAFIDFDFISSFRYSKYMKLKVIFIKIDWQKMFDVKLFGVKPIDPTLSDTILIIYM